MTNPENDAGLSAPSLSGPRLIRHHTTAASAPVSDQLYLAVYERARLARPGAGGNFSNWKLIGLSAAAGVALTFTLFTFSRGSGAANEMSSGVVATRSAPSPLVQATGNQTADEKLLARNRRLEALVEVLRERRKAKADSHLSHISTD